MSAQRSVKVSPFLHPGRHAKDSSLSILHLKRDHLLPVFLSNLDGETTGYAEGNVANTRFGSYPHSTLIDQPWGAQVLASKVDTGSRRRKHGSDGTEQSAAKKRKVEAVNGHGAGEGTERHLAEHGVAIDTQVKADETQENQESLKSDSNHKTMVTAVNADSGFCHILPPTPEGWTVSLPHRTQVVYTPDYSYVLQKLRVRPGSVVIEAGAGSGSFTHAAARAVFRGYTDAPIENQLDNSGGAGGKVYSFEYHAPRAEQLQREIAEHGLSSVVQITHRDVYTDGFLVAPPPGSDALPGSDADSEDPPSSTPSLISPLATQVFLDLPAPWQALDNLTRQGSPSPLDPQKTIHLCAFMPCIEQVTRTVSALRARGWVEVTMQELMHRRIDVRRERIGIDLEGQRGVNSMPASVDESLRRLREVESAERRYRERGREMQRHRLGQAQSQGDSQGQGRDTHPQPPDSGIEGTEGGEGIRGTGGSGAGGSRGAAPVPAVPTAPAVPVPAFRDGYLVHRTEPDLKTHTSYLVFAVLPRAWSLEDEAVARAKYPLLPPR